RRRFREELQNLPRAQRMDDATRHGIAMRFVQSVYQELGADVPGTGVRPSALARTQANVSGIENWLRNNLRSDQNQINQIPFLQSRYRFNTTGRGVIGNSPWWFSTSILRVLDHGIAPTIRIRGREGAGQRGTLMGTDKWGHFFQQGFWLFAAHQRNQLQTL